MAYEINEIINKCGVKLRVKESNNGCSCEGCFFDEIKNHYCYERERGHNADIYHNLTVMKCGKSNNRKPVIFVEL